jgi:phosphate starvation-inducible protein PhoH
MAVSKRDNDKDFDLKNNKERDKMYGMFSDEQKEFFHSIQNHTFTFCESEAGTGKTLVATASMLDLLANTEINKIVYLQKVSKRNIQNGFNPGTLEQKTEDLWDPFYEAMLDLGYIPPVVDMMIANELILLTTDSNLRGVNFKKVGLIIDEAENCDFETLKLIFTRCHDDCHIALIGDSKQKDNPGGKNNDFVLYGDYLVENLKKRKANKCLLTCNYRGDFSKCAEMFFISDYKKKKENKESMD